MADDGMGHDPLPGSDHRYQRRIVRSSHDRWSEPLEENVAYHTSRYQEHSSNTADPEPRTCHGLTALENSQVKDFQYQLAVYIYNKGIGAGKFSAATAVGLFQSLIGLILVLLSDKFAKKLGEDGLL